MEILKSKNYDKFTRPFNRDINESKVKLYSQFLKENPAVFQSPCIRVDSKFRIIDGQHRYLASVATENFIYYTIDYTVETDEQLIDAIITSNQSTLVFTGKDYLQVTKGLSPDHQFLHELCKSVKDIVNFSSVLYLVDIKTPTSASKYKCIRDKNLSICNKTELFDFFSQFRALYDSCTAPTKIKNRIKTRWYLGALYDIYFYPQPRFNFKIIKERINTHWERLGCPGSKESAREYLKTICLAQTARF